MPGIPRRRGTQYAYLRKRMEFLKNWRFLMQPSLEDVGSSISRFLLDCYSFAVLTSWFLYGNKIAPRTTFVNPPRRFRKTGHRRAFFLSCFFHDGNLFQLPRFSGAFFPAIMDLPRFRRVTQFTQIVLPSAILTTPDIGGEHFAALREGDRLRRETYAAD
ncbi:MAG: hypothetical protein MJ078_08135 [Clostridia bacterium]|nr:hypothetical protein [Clostridia bacterium]